MASRRRFSRFLISAWLPLTSLLLVFALVVPASSAMAEESPPALQQIPPAESLVESIPPTQPSPSNSKLGSSLNQLLSAQQRAGQDGAEAYATTHLMVVDDARVQVEIVTVPEAVPELIEYVEASGGEYQGHYEGLLQALAPISELEALAARPDVLLVREPQRLVPDSPLLAVDVTSEGVAASNAPAWHGASLDGTGARVAIFDAGFNGYAGLLGTELPSSVKTYDHTGGGMGSSPHGTAVAEIVHDMAPGAKLSLHRINTPVNLSQAVTQAVNDGADIISMSVSWTLDGPGDGTGTLANIVGGARSNGILLAKSAGNNGQVSWSGSYSNYRPGSYDYLAWDGAKKWFNFIGPGDGRCYVIPFGRPVMAGLHWDDWNAVNQNYDLHLYRWPLSGSTLYRVASSTNAQNGGAGQTPQEFLAYSAAGGNCYAWVVEKVKANRTACLRLLAPGMTHLDEWTPQRSLSFPADAPSVMSVAAVDVSKPYPLEAYSSRGPTFGGGGACTGGKTKPDIAAFANVSTASYGPRVFDGTSAATPHVAGAAALVKDAFPGYSAGQLESFLEGRAVDMGPAGKDTMYGAGRLFLGAPPGGPVTMIYLPVIQRVYLPW